MRQRILELIQSDPLGLTTEEVSLELEWKSRTVSARITELIARDQVYVDGVRRLTVGGTAPVYKAKHG